VELSSGTKKNNPNTQQMCSDEHAFDILFTKAILWIMPRFVSEQSPSLTADGPVAGLRLAPLPS
jgi:hypothetical protein